MDKKKIFVIMPFRDEFFEVYEMLKEQFKDEYEFANANDVDNPQNIMRDVIQPIYEADVLLADLTGPNPNVMYELGVAHALNRKTIMITQDSLDNLPFDLKQYRAINYSTHFKKFSELIEQLSKWFKGAIDNSVTFSNPVEDFLTTKHIESVDWSKQNRNESIDDVGEAGFLDFLAEIETDSIEMATSINSINNDLNEMNRGIIASVDKINKTGGSGTSSFIRKEARKVSNLIDTFSSKFDQNNDCIDSLWDKIEKNTLGLIESPFFALEMNKTASSNYIRSLKNLKCKALESKPSIERFKSSVNNIIGLEKTLTQSARFLISDLETYISFIDRLDKSIEKIVSKSQFVIGKVE